MLLSRLTLGAAVLAAAAAGAAGFRAPLLRAAGSALVSEDPLTPEDIVVVASDADGAGVLEAADLVHAGIAPAVAVFEDPPDAVVDREFLRRGVAYEDASARSVRQLSALGVERIVQIPRAVAGTEDEGRALPAWCDSQRFRSVLVVGTTDHSRRLRRVLRRAMKGHATTVHVRASRFSSFAPDRWWQTRGGTRTELIELEKLFLDVVRHPL